MKIRKNILLANISGFLVGQFVEITYRLIRKRSFNFRLGVTRLIGLLLYYSAAKARKTLRRNITLIRPDLANALKKLKENIRLVIETICRSWAAMLGNEFTNEEEVGKQVLVEGDGFKQLLACHKENKKMVIVAVHVGPIDEMIGVIHLYQLRAYIPLEKIKPEKVFNLMMRLRLQHGDIVFDPVERGKTYARVKEQLNTEKRVVIIFIDFVDQKRKDDNGVLCRVGNAKIRFSVSPIKLAYDDPEVLLFPVLPSWQKEEMPKVNFLPPFEIKTNGDERRDIEENTRRLIEEVFTPHIQKYFYSWLRLLWPL